MFKRKLTALVVASSVLSGLFVWQLVSAWRAQSRSGNLCQVAFQPMPPGLSGYIEFRLKEEEPVEPLFDGNVFISLADRYGTQPMRLSLERSPIGTYARSTTIVDLGYDQQAGALWMGTPKEFDLVRASGSHRNFPFDSASLAFDIKVTPAVDLRVVRVYNQVSGFVMDCDALKANRSGDGLYHIELNLSRNPLVQLTAVILGVASLAFLVLAAFMKPETLPTSVASFFFSLWSIRAILSSQIKTFPTLLDSFILTLCATLLLILGWKLTLANGKSEAGRQGRKNS